MDDRYWDALGGPMILRPNTADEQVVRDTVDGRYHLPPKDVDDPEIILDLGANIGATMRHFAMVYPRACVIGVEMDLGNYMLCEKNIAAVRDHTVLFNYAATADDVRQVYYRQLGVDTWAYAIHPDGECRAPAISFDRLASSWNHIDYVKMDIEGAEKEILKKGGTWPRMVTAIKVEVHEPYDREEARRDLKRLGFYSWFDDSHPSCVVGVARG